MAVYDIDALLEKWELKFTIDGKEYTMRRPTLADLKGVAELASQPGEVQIEYLKKLFEGAAPPFDNLDHVEFVAKAFAEYERARRAKNTGAVDRALRAAAEKINPSISGQPSIS